MSDFNESTRNAQFEISKPQIVLSKGNQTLVANNSMN